MSQGLQGWVENVGGCGCLNGEWVCTGNVSRGPAAGIA